MKLFFLTYMVKLSQLKCSWPGCRLWYIRQEITGSGNEYIYIQCNTHIHTLIKACQSHVLSLPLQVKWFVRHCSRCSCQHQLCFSVWWVIKHTVAIFHTCSSWAVVCISNQLIYFSADSSGRTKCSRGYFVHSSFIHCSNLWTPAWKWKIILHKCANWKKYECHFYMLW